MARQKTARQKKRREAEVDGFELGLDFAWDQFKQALELGIANGKLAEHAGVAHAEALALLLKENPDIARSLFQSGFFGALAIMQQTAQIMSAVIPHDCDEPGHAHGAAQTSRIGRA